MVYARESASRHHMGSVPSSVRREQNSIHGYVIHARVCFEPCNQTLFKPTELHFQSVCVCVHGFLFRLLVVVVNRTTGRNSLVPMVAGRQTTGRAVSTWPRSADFRELFLK